MNGADAKPELPTSYPLKFPLELKAPDGSVRETISELQLNRLNGGQVTKLLNARDKGTGEFTKALVCAVAQIAPAVYDRLDGTDAIAAAEVCADFLGVGPKT